MSQTNVEGLLLWFIAAALVNAIRSYFSPNVLADLSLSPQQSKMVPHI